MPSGLLLSGTAFALLLAYTVRFLAVGLANIAPGLAAIDPAMDASARVLGARPREVLRRIHLPLLRGPMLTAAVVAFVEVMKELPATLLIRPFNSIRWRSASTASPPTSGWRRPRSARS